MILLGLIIDIAGTTPEVRYQAEACINNVKKGVIEQP